MGTPQRPRGAPSPGAQTTLGPAPAAEATPSPTVEGAASSAPAVGTPALVAADVQPAEDDHLKVTKVRLEGLDERELDELGHVALKVGLELACQRFEDGELRTGRVVEVHEDGLFIVIDELGWRWPVRTERVNPAAGEWVHAPGDYRKPGEDPRFDRDHRMSAEARAEEDRRKAEGERPKVHAAAHEPAAPHAQTPAAPEPLGVLATWKGPGGLAGPWVRERDRRQLDLAPAGSRGWFPRNVVESPVHKKQFDVHP